MPEEARARCQGRQRRLPGLYSPHAPRVCTQANVRGEATSRGDLAAIAVHRMAPSLSAAALSTAFMGTFMFLAGTMFTIRFGIFILLLM